MAMAQHFLLSAEARTLSLAVIYKSGEDQYAAEAAWKEDNRPGRSGETGG